MQEVETSLTVAEPCKNIVWNLRGNCANLHFFVNLNLKWSSEFKKSKLFFLEESMIENDVSGDDIVISRYFRVLKSNMVSCAVCVLSTGCCAD